MFTPTHDWRNYRTTTRECRTQAGQRITVAQDTTEARVYLGHGGLVMEELQLTPAEAFALGAELMNAAMQAQAQPLETT